MAMAITISPVLRLQLTQTAQELKITNNLTTTPVLPHVGQTPIGIDDQGGHGGDWRQIVDGEVLLVQINPFCVLSALQPKMMTKPDRGASRMGSFPL